MASNKKVSSKKKQGKKTYTFNFTFSGLCSLSLLTIIVMAWIFIFGVLVGRGYEPESFWPQLAKILPGNSKTSVPAEQKTIKQDEILKAEELGFYEQLESVNDNAGSKTIERSRQKKAPEKQKSVLEPEKQENTGSRQSLQDRPKPEDTKRYAYIYQVSAFRDLAQARRIQAQLRELGIPSSMKTIKKNGATWHRIYVPFKGRPAETRQLKAKLRSLGITKPFLRSKKEL